MRRWFAALVASLVLTSTADAFADANEVAARNTARVDSLDFTRVVSTTGFVVGAVGLAVGIPLLLLGKEGSGAPQSSALTPWVGPNGAGLSGRF
jgi:hypothetical protein